MKLTHSIAKIALANPERMVLAAIAAFAVVMVTQIASMINQWKTNHELEELSSAVTGIYGDWKNREPLTIQAEKTNEALQALQMTTEHQKLQTQEFIDLTRESLSAIQAVAETQVGRGGIIKRIERESKKRDEDLSQNIETLRAHLKDIQWIIKTQSVDDKGRPIKPSRRK